MATTVALRRRFYIIIILIIINITSIIFPLIFLISTTATTTDALVCAVVVVTNHKNCFRKRRELPGRTFHHQLHRHHDSCYTKYDPIRRKVPAAMFGSHSNQDHWDGDDDDDNDDKMYCKKGGNVDTMTSSNIEIVSTTTTKYNKVVSTITSNPTRSLLFSISMSLSGAILGPFLDSYHSLYNVLQYDQPLTFSIFSKTTPQTNVAGGLVQLLLVTTYWVPPLFAIAGFLIGWMYILLDVYYHKPIHSNTTTDCSQNDNLYMNPPPPKILFGIAYFTFQYWLSGYLYQTGIVSRDVILGIMSLSALIGFGILDRTISGFITSLATALGGPLIEVGLITLSRHNDALFHGMGYHYTDLGETGYFPLWIVPDRKSVV